MTTGALPAASELSGPVTAHPVSVLDDVACLVVVVDAASGRVAHVNRALELLLGCPREALVGRAMTDLVDPADRPCVEHAVSSPTGPLSGVEAVVLAADGARRRVLWAAKRAPAEDRHVVLTGIDVTPEGQASGLFSQLVRSAAAPGLVATDREGRVTLCNAAAERLLGRPAADLVGRRLDLGIFDREEFVERAGRLDVPPDLRLLAADLSRLDRRRSNLDLGALDRRRGGDGPPREGGERRERRGTAADRRSGGTLARDWTLVRPDGERFTASLQVVKVTDDSGAVVGYLGVAHDVTEQRRSRHLLVAGLEREAEALRRLKELDRAKDDFVATVSHELRTPITNILGYVEVLLDAVGGGLDGSHVEMLDAVRRNGNRLRALADDLLTLSSFQSGEFTFDPAPVDLGEVVRHVEESVRPMVADRRLALTFTVPEKPVVLVGDAALLERMLFHLLSNALKFTEDGGSIACTLGATCDSAVLSISDTGVGVPAGERDQLFAPFVRSTTSFERASQGAGMGLAIVSTIVERHGGQVRLESVERQGTEVTVVLPVEPSAVTAQIPTSRN